MTNSESFPSTPDALAPLPSVTEAAGNATPLSDDSIGGAHYIISAMYEAINRRDVDAAMGYIDPDCVYQDLNFPQPFQGKAAVRQLFIESCQKLPADLQFVIDDITTGEGQTVGILWHVELAGIPFPNGRGVSFYRLSDTSGQIVLARDGVEPPLKPGHVAFGIIRLVAPLVRRFGPAASRFTVPSVPAGAWFTSGVLWAIALLYTYILLLSPPGQWLPGEPIWAIQPETLREVVDESTNFFLILPLLNALGVSVMSAPVVHPTTEALFNLAEAWIFMFLPLLLLDRRGQGLPKVPIWSGAMFLTNVFLTPYMALRASKPRVTDAQPPAKGLLARSFGATGLVVATGAIAWGLLARPEFGGVMEREHYFLTQLLTNRVAIAFCVDLTLFAVFQAILIGAIEPQDSPKRWLRFIPLWGLALWLLV